MVWHWLLVLKTWLEAEWICSTEAVNRLLSVKITITFLLVQFPGPTPWRRKNEDRWLTVVLLYGPNSRLRDTLVYRDKLRKRLVLSHYILLPNAFWSLQMGCSISCFNFEWFSSFLEWPNKGSLLKGGAFFDYFVFCWARGLWSLWFFVVIFHRIAWGTGCSSGPWKDKGTSSETYLFWYRAWHG